MTCHPCEYRQRHLGNIGNCLSKFRNRLSQMALDKQWQRQSYEWTVSRLESMASWWNLGLESKWPTLSSPSATTTELPWSKALNPLLMLLHGNHQNKTDCSAAPWCVCSRTVNGYVGHCKKVSYTSCQNIP